MADSNRPRRVVGSRNPTGRPRKVAGQSASPPVVEPVETPEPVEPVETPESVEPVETPQPDARSRLRRGGIGGRRTTVALVMAIVALAGVAGAEVFYLTDDATPTVSAQRPVVTGEITHRAAVEAAARSTEEILSTSYQDYDDQVEQATAKMTDTFAEQYRQTSAGIRDRFIAQKTQLQVKAVAQGVVQASPSQVQALLFLNQYVQKVQNGRPGTDYAQYRALVTVVHTDHGWLVSDIETK
jgi:Mce-associated membrane protein